MAAALLAAVLAVVPLAGAGRSTAGLVPLAALGVLGVAAALLGVAPLLGLGLFALAAEFAVRQLVDGLPAAAALGYAVGLLVLCELVASAATLPRAAMVERTVVARRLLALAAASSVGAAAAALLLVGAGVVLGAALLAACIGFAGALGLLFLVASSLRG